MDLKNMQMGDIKEKILAVADKKTLIKFGIGLGSIILFLIVYYAVLNPLVKDRKAKYEDKLLKQNEINQFENDIATLKARIKKLSPEVKEKSTLFHSKAEVEGLYNTFSRFAGNYGLVISKIEKKKAKPILKEGMAKQAEKNIKKK